jgi:hypothetical protein
VRRAIEGLPPRIIEAGAEHFGPAALDEAWRDFNLGATDEPLADDNAHLAAFLSWYCYLWLPLPEHTQAPPASRTATAAQAFLATRGKRVDPLARRYIEACACVPFSFHEVLSCEPGRGFRLRDLLLGDTRYVFEASASEQANRGDVIYASVVELDGVALMEGCGAALIPPAEIPRIVALRGTLVGPGKAVHRERLAEREADVRKLYFEITDRLLTRTLPRLQNTDEEPIEMNTLVYEIPSAREAYEALKDLAGGESDEALLREAVFDTSGALARVDFRWVTEGNAMHKSWDSTSLGTLRIDGTRLAAEVNSAARAQRLAGLVEARLGERARKLPSVVESVHSLLHRERTPAEQEADRRRAEEHAALNQRPEVQALIGEMTRKHYRDWVDQPVPALGNRTPRDAMKSADGRQAVEALVVQLERDSPRMQPPLDPSVTQELRETLGLPSAPRDEA